MSKKSQVTPFPRPAHISSDPLYICICENNEACCTASSITKSVYPGGKIEISVVAFGQRNGKTPAVIRRRIPAGGEIIADNTENTRRLTHQCNSLNYTVQTTAAAEGTTQEMSLLLDDRCPAKERTVSSGPTNTIKILVSIRQCPPGFQWFNSTPACICAQRLQTFTNTCRIDDQTVETNGEFWVGYDENDGLILHPHCPFDYCTSQNKYIAVNDSDAQCSCNRAGLLCGKCSQNFSIAFGTNCCLKCSNDLWLLVVFAFAGIALVFVLYLLRLTVAVGTINGLLFYANVFSINSATFVPTQNSNILTVFIAWLNMDLGIETCFYDGMDMYAKSWLQFVFPLYVWVILIAIIIVSHYSIRISRILSSSTIEVLATLVLLSYAKLLQTVIVPLSSTFLEYPHNSQVAVWLYDANIRYLSPKHIPLFLAAVICLIVLFLPYTMLLIFGQCLRGWRICSWVNNYRILPFLEAYHAPYTEKHRYWTGLMLLLRCILFLTFSFNVLGDPNVNLLCIACSTAILYILHALFGNRIYKSWPLAILELSFITNLCILAIATLYTRSSHGNQNAVTFTSIGIALATFIGIVVYHVVEQIKKVQRWWWKVFPSQRDDYDPIRPTGTSDSYPNRTHPSAAPTVSYLDIRELEDTAK